MSALYIVTGECHVKTEADVRLEYADALESQGEHDRAAEYRVLVDKMRSDWADPKMHVKAGLGLAVMGPDPNSIVPPLATSEHPMFWHEPRYDRSTVCKCGHFADYLCDEPVGKGRTCDAALCDCCRGVVGPEIDQCPFHATTQPRELVPS